jgi:hypothetical protein
MTTDSNTNAARETDLEGKCALIRAAYAADMAELVDRITRGESIVDPTFRMPTRLQAVVRDLTAQSPASAPEQASEQDAPRCYGCGKPYNSPGWIDCIVPDEVWAQINPSANEGGGILCINCISDRCAAHGLENVPVQLKSGALSPLPSGVREQQAEQGDGGVELLLAAIRKHRDQRGDDRCWRDDEELYRVLPEGYTPPARDSAVELENCKRFIACRQSPSTEYVSPEREIERLKVALTQPPRQSEDGRMLGTVRRWRDLSEAERRQISKEHPRPEHGYEAYWWRPLGAESWERTVAPLPAPAAKGEERGR